MVTKDPGSHPILEEVFKAVNTCHRSCRGLINGALRLFFSEFCSIDHGTSIVYNLNNEYHWVRPSIVSMQQARVVRYTDSDVLVQHAPGIRLLSPLGAETVGT